MSNNRKKVSISVDLIPQIYELSAVKCLNDASTIALVLKIFKEITSKVDVSSMGKCTFINVFCFEGRVTSWSLA